MKARAMNTFIQTYIKVSVVSVAGPCQRSRLPFILFIIHNAVNRVQYGTPRRKTNKHTLSMVLAPASTTCLPACFNLFIKLMLILLFPLEYFRGAEWLNLLARCLLLFFVKRNANFQFLDFTLQRINDFKKCSTGRRTFPRSTRIMPDGIMRQTLPRSSIGWRDDVNN